MMHAFGRFTNVTLSDALLRDPGLLGASTIKASLFGPDRTRRQMYYIEAHYPVAIAKDFRPTSTITTGLHRSEGKCDLEALADEFRMALLEYLLSKGEAIEKDKNAAAHVARAAAPDSA